MAYVVNMFFSLFSHINFSKSDPNLPYNVSWPLFAHESVLVVSVAVLCDFSE